jgi:hypothetical protein
LTEGRAVAGGSAYEDIAWSSGAREAEHRSVIGADHVIAKGLIVCCSPEYLGLRVIGCRSHGDEKRALLVLMLIKLA